MERMVWVIKDQNGNFVNARSIGKSDEKTWIYVSFKTFSEEARAYSNIESAEKALIKLEKWKAIAGFIVEFHLEYCDLNEISRCNRGYDRDNMVLVEICEARVA